VAEPVEVAFYLPQADDIPEGVGVEFLWAEPLGGDRYRILTLPSFVDGIAVDDVITATTSGPELAFESVIERSGRSMIQVVVEDSDVDPDVFMAPLKDLGCVFHRARKGSSVYSVDVPASVDIVQVLGYLEEAKSREVADWRARVLAEDHGQAEGP
jgi:hypothetical protein